MIDRLRQLGACYLLLQSVGGLVFWGVLLTRPDSRRLFLPVHAPDSTILAFFLPDLLLYLLAGLTAAGGLLWRRRWAGPLLAVHAGAAAYAALYCLLLAALAPESWRGALFMSPNLIITPFLAWRFAHA